MQAGDFIHLVTAPARLIWRECRTCACRRQQLNAAGWGRLPWALWSIVAHRDFEGLPPLVSGDQLMALVSAREVMSAKISVGDDPVAHSQTIDARHALMIMLSRSHSPRPGLYQLGWADYRALLGQQ